MRIPDELATDLVKRYGEAGQDWTAAAPGLIADCLERWQLRVDGPAMHGAVAIVVPVVRGDCLQAVLKLCPQFERHIRDEPIALRAWDGDGAVRLLETDPASGAMLLERLDAASQLYGVADDIQALQILSELLARLTALPAPPGLLQLSGIGAQILDRAQSALARDLAEPMRSLVSDCAATLREVLPEPGNRLLHVDLHYCNILAAGQDDPREPWLAIDPAPMSGDPGFDLLPALHNRWAEVVATGDVPRAVRRRFDLMTDVLGLDRARARQWTLARILQDLLGDIEKVDTRWHSERDQTIALTLLASRCVGHAIQGASSLEDQD